MPIEPALTAEEWAIRGAPIQGRIGKKPWAIYELDKQGRLWMPDATENYECVGRERHCLAALCLHGQPYGFTWADVELIRYALGLVHGAGDWEDAKVLDSLADRIAALLPPREAAP